MHASLPRELRDLIYSHIWDKEYLEPCAKRMCAALQGMDYDSCGPLPHIIEPTHANPIVAREALEAYYHCAAGVVDVFVAEQPPRLPSLLYGDVFGLGVKPTAHLKKLRLEVLLDSVHMDRLAADLNQLFDIVHKKNFTLHVLLQSHRIRLKLLDEAFAIVVPVCRALRAQGVRVRLDWVAVTHAGMDTSAEYPFDYMIDAWHPDMAWKERMMDYLDELCSIDREYEHELKEDYDPSDYFI